MSTNTNGKVNEAVFNSYNQSVYALAEVNAVTISQVKEIELSFIREAVASDLSVRDLQATLKAGKESAEAEGYEVLPHLGVGKVQVWARALAIYDTVEGAQDLPLLTPKDKKVVGLLDLAWNSQRLADTYEIEGKTVEQVKADTPPVTAGKAEGNKAPRKATSRANLTISQITAFIESFIESLPDNVADIDDVTVIEIAKLAKSVSRLSKAVKQAA